MTSRPPEPEGQALLRVVLDDQTLVLSPGEASRELDTLLDGRGAQTLVFLPLFAPGKDTRKRGTRPSRKAREKRWAKLGTGDWCEGELEPLEAHADPIPAAWQLDLRRYRARLIAEALGLKSFYWACRGEAVEVHQVEPVTEDEALEVGKIRHLSRIGLTDLRHTLLHLERLGDATRAVGSDLVRLRRVALLVIGASIAACALLTLGAPYVDRMGTALRTAYRALAVLAHPLLLPALTLGGYLRQHLSGETDAGGSDDEPVSRRRELTQEESALSWYDTAPHLLAIWAIAGVSVVLLALGRLAASGELTPVELVDDATTYILVALWMLTPLTYARDTASAIGSCIEAAITVFVLLFVLKLTMIFTNAATAFLWRVAEKYAPIEIPDWVRIPFESVTAITAELFFFTLILGYTWTKAREHFGRWATVSVG